MISSCLFSAEELAAKTAELESVKASFADYATSAKALEAEMENALEMAQAKILKLSKKNSATTEKYNELTDTYNSLTEELTRLQTEVETLKAELRNKSRDANTSYITMNEELTTKVTTLTTTMESYRLQIEKFTKEKTTMQSEIDELYTSKYETELKHADYVTELQVRKLDILSLSYIFCLMLCFSPTNSSHEAQTLPN